MPYAIRTCPLCETEFAPSAAGQKYCHAHKNRHAKGLVDRRKAGADGRRVGYYRTQCCEVCGVEFEPRSGVAKYCGEHQRGSWERNNPERAKESARRGQRRYRHKLQFGDADVYERLAADLGEACAICGRVPERGWHLAVDHDHTTGKLRALLCPRCNTGLGYFGESADRLRAAASYLDGH